MHGLAAKVAAPQKKKKNTDRETGSFLALHFSGKLLFCKSMSFWLR